MQLLICPIRKDAKCKKNNECSSVSLSKTELETNPLKIEGDRQSPVNNQATGT